MVTTSPLFCFGCIVQLIICVDSTSVTEDHETLLPCLTLLRPPAAHRFTRLSYTAPNCHGSVASALVNGNLVTSFYWEVHDSFDVVKVTPLAQWLSSPAKADGAIVCLNLQAPCWQAQKFSFNPQLLEYALYDRKVDGYECCPTGTVLLTTSAPGFPSRPPPGKTPPLPPDVPLSPREPSPLQRAKKSPLPPPPSPPRPPPPPSPPRPRPPKGKKSPPPSPPSIQSPWVPVAQRPPSPPALSSQCNLTVIVHRSAASNQGFTDAVCELFGTLILLPLNEGIQLPQVSYSCMITDATNMVLTLTMATGAAARALMNMYRVDAVQRQSALALLSLTDCSRDFARIATTCLSDLAPVVG